MSAAPSENRHAPLGVRFARWLLDFVLRHWPAETRSWGMALAAEIDDAPNSFAALRWSLGGISLFARAALAAGFAWLKLPAGAPVPASAAGPVDPALVPKRSRLFTAAIIAITVALLFLPEAREAVSTVRASWQNFQQSPADRRTLENLAARAEKDKDAAALAFVALSIDDRARASAFSDSAVSLDPNFVWVYGARTRWPGPGFISLSDGQLARLEASDPGNAVPYLLAADAHTEPRIEALIHGHSTPMDEIQSMLAGDPQWQVLMEHAFAAPRYDDYYNRRVELMRSVWNRESDISPSIALTPLWSYGTPGMDAVNIFSGIKIQQARADFAAGNFKQGEALLAEIESFGERVTAGSQERFEIFLGLSISLRALREQATLEASAGRVAEFRNASLGVQKIDAQLNELRTNFILQRDARDPIFRRSAMLVQGSGILALIAGFASLMGIALLEFRRPSASVTQSMWRKAACFAADYAPATLVAATAVFLVSFMPYAHALAEYRSSTAAFTDRWQIIQTLTSLFPYAQYMEGAGWRYFLWSCITVALAALAVFIAGRSIYKLKRAHANHI